MPTRLTGKAIEQSTYVVIASFYDATSFPVTPTAVRWTLTDRYGAIINNREDVDVLELSPDINIVLSGDDLQVVATGVTRILTVRGYYDSSLGSGLPINDVCFFEVQDLLAVT